MTLFIRACQIRKSCKTTEQELTALRYAMLAMERELTTVGHGFFADHETHIRILRKYRTLLVD